jgi:hypothetical protein
VNPYRTAGVRMAMATIAPLLGEHNRLEIQLS